MDGGDIENLQIVLDSMGGLGSRKSDEDVSG